MPRYSYKNKRTGQIVSVDRDAPPTDQELYDLMNQQAKPAEQPAVPAEAPAAEAPEPSGERGLGTTLREMGTETAATMGGQAIGTALLPGVGTVVGGALGGGAGNLINQFQRMSKDPEYKFKWGEFLADVGTGAIPGGGIAKTGAKAVAREAVKQGVGGLAAATTQKVLDEGQLPSGQELLLATAVPAAGGAAAQKLLSGASSSVSAVRRAFAGRSKELRTFEEGAAKGLKVVPSDIDPSFGVTQLESLGGKAAVNQRTQLANQDAVNNMVKEQLGVARDVELSPQVFKNIREQEGRVYEQVDALAERARRDLKRLQQARVAATNVADPAQRAIEEANFNARYGRKEARLTEQAAASLEDLRKVRGDMQKMWDSYYASGGKNVDAQQGAIALKAQAETLEDTIDRVLRRTGKSNLADQIVPARQRIAQSYNAEEMLNPGNFNIDPDVALRMLKRGVPLSGNLKTLADFKAAFPNSLRETSKVPSPDVSLLGTFAQGALGAGLGITSGSVPTAVAGALAIPAARKGARELLLSQPMQRAAYQAALPKAAPTLGVGAVESGVRAASQQLGQESTARPAPPQGAINLLLKNPALADEFDAKYGPGASRRYLKTR